MGIQNRWTEIVAGFFMGVLFSATVVSAGTLEPAAGPTEPGSQMHTLDAIYIRIDCGPDCTSTKMTEFREPTSGPTAGTKHTLDEIYEIVGFRAPVAKTGQTVSTYAGDDGALRKGVTWPNPRFAVSSDGTMTDKLTGIVWLRNADCFAPKTRWEALDAVSLLQSGQCGLSDGSVAGDWRLPNARELQSLIDFAYAAPALSNAAGTGPYSGDTFTGGGAVPGYWSSTTYAGDPTKAWLLVFDSGILFPEAKVNLRGVLAIRMPGA